MKGFTPYYAVIFTTVRAEGDLGYAEMADRMEALARVQPGFLGFETARSEIGISVSYWKSLDDIARWKENAQHLEAQRTGREKWYEHYTLRICRVEREYGFNRDPQE
ncbi:Heme-degrading monooxygenase HmoA [Muriicola jejuensis]|uniref:Antibiotic biosynthesis monooxygenase n=1 Tax=Muriicola jejuensis TaxID=504488 RepID=A0A6P0UEH6_9FLAO|nr:antibiotic biosynthesis monooxygenase [Muriicola jejuensis]NER10148.1 antibiotic biosynthesis monooxygenase [Muriicola jejuensis]SMP02669.1 Heme-degrading monooxygenase HmoA [Muriicola jejuensis]